MVARLDLLDFHVERAVPFCLRLVVGSAVALDRIIDKENYLFFFGSKPRQIPSREGVFRCGSGRAGKNIGGVQTRWLELLHPGKFIHYGRSCSHECTCDL